jgi:isocitrate dehydrogenase
VAQSSSVQNTPVKIAPVKVAVAKGDGIGPEIMEAVLEIMKCAGAKLDLHEVTVGMKAYEAGETKGISDADFDVLQSCKALLKAPLSTPQGKGYSSVNVAIRKRFDLFANIRPSVSLEPVIAPRSNASNVDMVIVRENLEDLYAGIEHRPTKDVAVGRKVSTRSESERIMRAAFEYARANGREKVTAIAKDNIQKMTDGTNFHDVFDVVATDYPDIKAEFYIADIGIARLGARPNDFDVVVTQNMYGDIGSDVVSEALGSVGLSGSANLGQDFAMFEAVHGTAPDIAGKNMANPSGLLMAAVMMLNYCGQSDAAEKIHNAWLRALEEGDHTGDIYGGEYSKNRVGTLSFAASIIGALGKKPQVLTPVDYSENALFELPVTPFKAAEDDFEICGVDVQVQHTGTPQELAEQVQARLKSSLLSLDSVMTARGDIVWPEPSRAFLTDYYTLRMVFSEEASFFEKGKKQAVARLLGDFTKASVNWRELNLLTKTPQGDLNFR